MAWSGRKLFGLPPLVDALEHFVLYETKSKFYLVASNAQRDKYRMLKINRADIASLSIDEDPSVYDEPQIKALLNMVLAGNAGQGGGMSKCVPQAFGIVGFIRFLQGYHLVLVTARRKVGMIGPHVIWAVEDTVTVSMAAPDLVEQMPQMQAKSLRNDEASYKSLFSVLDLTKHFYFSYTYDLTNTLQHNMLAYPERGVAVTEASASVKSKPKTMYVWNSFMIENFASKLSDSSLWSLPLLHGFFEQVHCRVNRSGGEFSLTLLSRRSRYYAGTRYLKRGISESGYVANDVETEQILHDPYQGDCKFGQFTSYVQFRASIPLFWCQDGNLMVGQPAIVVARKDPAHRALQMHISDVFRRYGSPCLMVNLVQQQEQAPRESIIGSLFTEAIEQINQFLPTQHQIDYYAWDFKKVSKSKTDSVVDELAVIAEWALQRTGLFHSYPHTDNQAPAVRRARSDQSKSIPRPSRESVWPRDHDFEHLNLAGVQSGVLRSNCIDSLDRTNVAQFCVGKCALGYQLFAMGRLSSNRMDEDSELISLLLELYERMGDALAQQYGGSQMHRSMKKDRDKSTTMAPILYRTPPATKAQELYVSIMRHYSNSFVDRDRQDAMNIFLGLFQPSNAFKENVVFVAAQPQNQQGMFSKLWNMVAGDNEEYLIEDESNLLTHTVPTLQAESDQSASTSTTTPTESSNTAAPVVRFDSLVDVKTGPKDNVIKVRRASTASFLNSSVPEPQPATNEVRRFRKRERENIWDLASDFYLHNARGKVDEFVDARPWLLLDSWWSDSIKSFDNEIRTALAARVSVPKPRLASSIESLNYHARTVSISNTITDSNEDLTYTIVLPSSPRQPTTSTVRTVQSAPLFWKSVYRPTELTSFDELLSIECIHPRNLRLHAAVARSAALPEKSVGSGDANQSRRQSLNFDVPITSTVSPLRSRVQRSDLIQVETVYPHWWLVSPGVPSVSANPETYYLFRHQPIESSQNDDSPVSNQESHFLSEADFAAASWMPSSQSQHSGLRRSNTVKAAALLGISRQRTAQLTDANSRSTTRASSPLTLITRSTEGASKDCPFGTETCGPLSPPSFALPQPPLVLSFNIGPMPQPMRRFYWRCEDTNTNWMNNSRFLTLHLASKMQWPWATVNQVPPPSASDSCSTSAIVPRRFTRVDETPMNARWKIVDHIFTWFNCQPGYYFPERSCTIVPTTYLPSQFAGQPNLPPAFLVHGAVLSPFYSFFASSWHESDAVDVLTSRSLDALPVKPYPGSPAKVSLPFGSGVAVSALPFTAMPYSICECTHAAFNQAAAAAALNQKRATEQQENRQQLVAGSITSVNRDEMDWNAVPARARTNSVYEGGKKREDAATVEMQVRRARFTAMETMARQVHSGVPQPSVVDRHRSDANTAQTGLPRLARECQGYHQYLYHTTVTDDSLSSAAAKCFELRACDLDDMEVYTDYVQGAAPLNDMQIAQRVFGYWGSQAEELMAPVGVSIHVDDAATLSLYAAHASAWNQY